jgi:sterol O-acyltransferase
MFLFTVRTYIRSMEENGYFIPLVFARQFSEDAITLAISDFCLVASTGLAVPFAMAIRDGWIQYYWVGVTLQHVWQTALLAVAVTWTFNR